MNLLIPAERDLLLHPEVYFIMLFNPELSCRTDCDVDFSKVTLKTLINHKTAASVLTRISASCRFRCGHQRLACTVLKSACDAIDTTEEPYLTEGASRRICHAADPRWKCLRSKLAVAY